MKKLLFFFGFVLCGLVANAQIPGIEDMNSAYADTLYIQDSTIHMKYTSCRSDSLSSFLSLKFTNKESHTISDSYIGTSFFRTDDILDLKLDLVSQSFEIVGDSSKNVYRIIFQIIPYEIDAISLNDNYIINNDTLVYCTIFGNNPVIQPNLINTKNFPFSRLNSDPFYFLNDSLSKVYINNIPVEQKKYVDLNLKNGDKLQIKRIQVKSSSNLLGCLVSQKEDTLKSPIYTSNWLKMKL